MYWVVNGRQTNSSVIVPSRLLPFWSRCCSASSASLIPLVVHGADSLEPQKVASTLLIRGRLPLPHLVRLSGVSPREARVVLLILIQHNIVWHSESDIDGQVYEINWEEPVARLRFGRYIMIAQENLGDPVSRTITERPTGRTDRTFKAAEIVSLILEHGKLRQEHVVELLAFGDVPRMLLPSFDLMKVLLTPS